MTTYSSGSARHLSLPRRSTNLPPQYELSPPEGHEYQQRVGLYDPRFERDSCGTGFVARTSGEPSRQVVDLALEAVARLEHRGAIAADGKSGDGAGVTTELPRSLFVHEAARLGYRLRSSTIPA